MKMNKVKIIVTFALLALAGSVNAQNQQTATASAHAWIVCPISLAKVSDIYWGKLVSSPNGSATINAATNGETYGNGADPGNTLHGFQTRAEFKVTGQGGETYNISHTNFPTIVSDGAGNTMTVAMDAVATAVTGTLGTIQGANNGNCNQTQNYRYGGTVTENGVGNSPGVYTNTNVGGSGVWTETVTYN